MDRLELKEAIDHAAEDVQETSVTPLVRDRTADEAEEIELKVGKFVGTVIEHPRWKGTLKKLRNLLVASKYNRSRRPRGMLIFGPSGVGKSRLTQAFADMFPRRDTEDCAIIPVLWVELPSQPTAKAIGEAILMALGDPLASAGSAELKLARVRSLLQKCGVLLVVVDEVQHLVDNLVGKPRDIAADAIKNLMNQSAIPFVLTGLPSSAQYLSVTAKQLGRRLNPKIKFSAFRFGTRAQREEFARVLLSFHEALPFEGASALIDAELTERFFFACYGLFGTLALLLEQALRLALEQRDQALTREHLITAFAEDVFPGCRESRNPFHPKFDGRPLDREGEPFYGLDKDV